MESRLNLNKDSAYTFADLNRLENNCVELQQILANMGKVCSITRRSNNWSYSDFIYATDMDRLVKNVSALKTAYDVALPEAIVPSLPPLFAKSENTEFSYSYFDKIEKNLYYIDSTIKGTDRAILYSGYPICGTSQYSLRGGM